MRRAVYVVLAHPDLTLSNLLLMLTAVPFTLCETVRQSLPLWCCWHCQEVRDRMLLPTRYCVVWITLVGTTQANKMLKEDCFTEFKRRSELEALQRQTSLI